MTLIWVQCMKGGIHGKRIPLTLTKLELDQWILDILLDVLNTEIDIIYVANIVVSGCVAYCKQA